MTRAGRSTAALVMSLLLLATAVSGAAAQSRTYYSGDDYYAPAFDMRELRIDNRPRKITFTMRMQDLRPGRDLRFELGFTDGRGNGHFIEYRGEDKRPIVYVTKPAPDGPHLLQKRYRCPGIRSDVLPRRDSVRVAIPNARKTCGDGTAYEDFVVFSLRGSKQQQDLISRPRPIPAS